MSISSAEFILAVLLAAAFFFRLAPGWPRRTALAVVNLAFLWSSLPNVGSWVALTAFVLSGFWVGRVLLRRPRTHLLVAYLVLMLLSFVVLKKYDVFLRLLPASIAAHSLAVIGLSYILFRQIHFLVDVLQGQIPTFSLVSYLNYQLNLLTLVSGPIQRYQEFSQYWLDPRPVAVDRHEILAALQRIMLGVIKVSVVASLCISYFNKADQGLSSAMSGAFPLTRLFALRSFVTMFYLYPAYVYFNFSGYCDVVIGAGRLLGQNLPENFNRPYVSRNVIEFWTRQHMTLSFWIRDYLFTPMYKAMAERWPNRANLSVFASYFVAFLLAGVWHGSTMNFVVFGLLHGLAVSVTKTWETYLVRTRGRAGYRQYLANRWTKLVSVTATLHFVALAFLFFTPDLNKTLRQIHAVVRAIL